ncbi:hypothetical protein [Deinococcus sonorensis]|uniref:Uncharacterized protein n=2 Tax=Deinococcus sonorensis TaxID=309891 RepID=A0AAU7U849_9DEIO
MNNTGKAVVGLLMVGVAQAGSMSMDTLLVSGAPSPCLAVKVMISQGGKSLSELYLTPDGKSKIQKGAEVHFKKGTSYRLQATCVSASTFSQNSGLNFTADGRTIQVQFSDNGFAIKRGGVAY